MRTNLPLEGSVLLALGGLCLSPLSLAAGWDPKRSCAAFRCRAAVVDEDGWPLPEVAPVHSSAVMWCVRAPLWQRGTAPYHPFRHHY